MRRIELSSFVFYCSFIVIAQDISELSVDWDVASYILVNNVLLVLIPNFKFYIAACS